MTTPILEARALSKSYGSVHAVDGLDLSVAAGEVVCLLGANGAGKTTTLNLFLGFAVPGAGAALVGGQSVHADLAAARAKLGYVAEQVALYPALSGARTLHSSTHSPARRS
jgi:ABC-2 type transport system ATP-binding protein